MFEGYKTYIGIALMVVPHIAGWFGFDTTAMFTEQFAETVVEVLTFVGACVAVYGRLVATVPGWFAKKPQQ